MVGQALAADPGGIKIRLASSGSLQAEPGTIVTTSFSVTSDSAATCIDSLTLPQGWVVIIPGGAPFTLKAAGQNRFFPC